MKLVVYGTLKYGYSNHYMLGYATRLENQVVDGFVMYGNNFADFPIVVAGEGTITAEVYDIKDKRCVHSIHMMELAFGYMATETEHGRIYVHEKVPLGWKIIRGGVW